MEQTKPWAQYLALFSVVLSFTGCGSLQKAAVSTTAGLIYDASKEIETETNWELFKKGVPANLKFMEGLLEVDPDNEELLVSLVKGYAGYAYGVSETLALEEKLKGQTRSSHHQTLAHYSRAIQYALVYLSQKGVSYNDLQKATRSDAGLPGLLKKHLDADSLKDRELVAFAAQAFAGYINLRRDEMSIVAQLPVAKGLFDWVCEAEPKINYGACDIFYAAYEAGRPKTLGGNPEKGKRLFLKALKKYPHNWLVRMSYVQYVILPQKDGKAYQEQKNYMKKWPQMMRENQYWAPYAQGSSAFENKGLGIYQSLALRRYEIIESHKSQIFQ